MSQPLGRNHSTIRRVRALRRDRSLARDEGVCCAEGLHLAAAALDHGARVELFVVSPRLESSAEGRALAARIRHAGHPVAHTSDTVLEGLQDARSPQPVLAVVARPPENLAAALSGASPLVAVACGLQDPGNLGGLWRTADAAGATGLLLVGPGADPFHPRTVRASMGSVFRLPHALLGPDALWSTLDERGVHAVAADPHGGQEHAEFDFRGPCALLFGAEGPGLEGALRERVQARVRIALREGVESLSVGAAAAVLLFEAARQRANGLGPTPLTPPEAAGG